MRRFIFRRQKKSPARKLHQVAVTRLILGQQGDGGQLARSPLRARCRIGGNFVELNPQGAADNRLNALVSHGLGKLQSPKKISRIRNSQGRHTGILGQPRHLLDVQGPLSQRVSRMGPEMDEGRKM